MSPLLKLAVVKLLILLCCLSLPAKCISQSAPPPTFTFDNPLGWERYVSNGLSMLTSQTEAGLGLLWANDAYVNRSAIKTELSQRYQEASTVLTPQGPPEVLTENAMGVYVTGKLMDTPCQGYLIGFHLADGGGNILITMTPDVFSAQRTRGLGLSLLNSIKPYVAPEQKKVQIPLGSNTLGSTGSAAAMVAGYRLASISSSGSYGGGYRSKEIINFCPSGLIRVETESSFYVSGGYGSAAQSDSDTVVGYWKLDGSGDQLVLTLAIAGQSSQAAFTVIRDGAGDLRFKFKDQVYGYYGAADCR